MMNLGDNVENFKFQYLFEFDGCNTNNTNRNLINKSKMAEYYSIFGRMVFSIQSLAEWYSLFASRLNTSFSNDHFLLCLLFDLGYRGLRFVATTYLETGLRFAEV